MRKNSPTWRRNSATKRQDPYAAAAEGYEARHQDSISVARFSRMEAPIVRAAAGHRILEIGCGTGRFLRKLHDAATTVGIDLSPAMLAHARAPRAYLAQADGAALPFAPGSFDCVVATKGTFRYLPMAAAYGEAARVLAPGGLLFVHQYNDAVRTRRKVSTHPGHITDLANYTRNVSRYGFSLQRQWLWRPIRVWPYLVPVPNWLAGRWWSHCVLLFSRCA